MIGFIITKLILWYIVKSPVRCLKKKLELVAFKIHSIIRRTWIRLKKIIHVVILILPCGRQFATLFKFTTTVDLSYYNCNILQQRGRLLLFVVWACSFIYGFCFVPKIHVFGFRIPCSTHAVFSVLLFNLKRQSSMPFHTLRIQTIIYFIDKFVK